MTTTPGGGRRGIPQARIHEATKQRLSGLRLQAQQLQNAFQGKHQRVWQVPAENTETLLDIEKLHGPAFNRDAMNEEYSQLTNSHETAGTVGDIISLKLQIDYNACEERAYRARHTTLARAMCLAHGRRFGHGHGNLWHPSFGVEAALAGWLAAGGAQPAGE